MVRASILDRFRPVGAPGPAGPAGIPAIDEPGHAAELAPVFAALAPEIESCRRLVDEAQQQAEDTLADAQADAAATVARARLAAASVRADAYAAIEQAATGQDERALAAARATASQLRASGAAQIPGVVRRVIDRLLADRLAS